MPTAISGHFRGSPQQGGVGDQCSFMNDASASNKVPSAQKISPTGIFILGNYLEIGNALPYRKNCFQELFGPVIVIKSVMENLAGKVLFSCLCRKPGKAPPLSTQLLPLMLVSLASGLVLAQAFFWGQEIFWLLHSAQTSRRAHSGDKFSGKKSEFGIILVKNRSSELNR